MSAEPTSESPIDGAVTPEESLTRRGDVFPPVLKITNTLLNRCENSLLKSILQQLKTSTQKTDVNAALQSLRASKTIKPSPRQTAWEESSMYAS